MRRGAITVGSSSSSSALSFIDSTGIRVLLSLGARCHELGIDVTFEKPSEAVERALRVAGLADLTD